VPTSNGSQEGRLLFRVAEAVVEELRGPSRRLVSSGEGETFHDRGGGPASGANASWYHYVCGNAIPIGDAALVIGICLGARIAFSPSLRPRCSSSTSRQGPTSRRRSRSAGSCRRETVLEEHEGTLRINRQYYELCVLQRLERAVKCKEVWVEGASAFRNPSQDMPPDWQEESQRGAYYQALGQPVTVTSFLDPLREQLTQTLCT
jgi:hypothetical protein